MKKIIFVLLVGLFFIGCGSGGSDESFSEVSYTQSDNSYVGYWEGNDRIYLMDDPDSYCVWDLEMNIDSDKTGYIKMTLIDSENDNGYCKSGDVTFKMENIDSDGFDAVITSSSMYTYFDENQTYRFSYSSEFQSLYYSNIFYIEDAYKAKEDIYLKKVSSKISSDINSSDNNSISNDSDTNTASDDNIENN